jgi:hypothetical protein
MGRDVVLHSCLQLNHGQIQCKPSMSEILPKRTYIGISLQLSLQSDTSKLLRAKQNHPHLQKAPQPCSLPIFRIGAPVAMKTTHHQFSFFNLLTSLLFFRPRRFSSRPSKRLSLRWCLFRRQHPPTRHQRRTKHRRPRPHSTIPTIHCNTLGAQFSLCAILSRRICSLGHKSRCDQGIVEKGTR